VTTPVLILHGVSDDRVPIDQGRELYANLSQLGKQVMLHQYPHEGHYIGMVFADRADAIYSQINWFDHYLKREPTSTAQANWHCEVFYVRCGMEGLTAVKLWH
jgi:dipeptidyl aminopeptidase/acylaminoacyl peptidase